jgi:hypothetical protein
MATRRNSFHIDTPKRNSEIRRIRCAMAARLGRGAAPNSCGNGRLN